MSFKDEFDKLNTTSVFRNKPLLFLFLLPVPLGFGAGLLSFLSAPDTGFGTEALKSEVVNDDFFVMSGLSSAGKYLI
jgi:hypothetical protein